MDHLILPIGVGIGLWVIFAVFRAWRIRHKNAPNLILDILWSHGALTAQEIVDKSRGALNNGMVLKYIAKLESAGEVKPLFTNSRGYLIYSLNR